MSKVLSRVLLMVCLAAGSAAADSPDLIGLSTRNGKLAADMLDLWFNQHRPADAFDKYVSRTDFTDHFGKDTLTHSFEQVRASEIKITGSNLHFDIRQIVAQGDLVFAHIHVTNGKPGFGNELVEIMRFKDDKLVEHWNIHVPLETDADDFFGRQ
jgi:predicted SnoaL-like aldol condensation-catalyzing enzyme